MASKVKRKQSSKSANAIISHGFSQLGWLTLASFLLGLLLLGGSFYVLFISDPELPLESWFIELFIGAASLILAGVLSALFVNSLGRRTERLAKVAIDQELHQHRMSGRRARALQQMASTMSATLSFERVMEVALQVCSVALDEMGVPSNTLVGGVFLYDRQRQLSPVASRRFANRDQYRVVDDKEGIIGQALKDAEPVTTIAPSQDSQLRHFTAFQGCQSAVAIPLRVGFQIFGVMLFGTEVSVQFNEDHLRLFDAVSDQAVIALQNAQLFQDLAGEKQRIIDADEDARKELARNLHDGPTQSVAAIAMHINFIRSLLIKNPRQALEELEKVERLAKDTSKEIRGMLFTLRPLILESDGLAAAIETLMDKLRENDKMNVRLLGADAADLISGQAQGITFSIIEEAIGNARKYSDAKLVEVKLWKEDDLFVAQIEDDGVGFDVENVVSNYSSRGSLGLVNMRERAARIDGSLKIESEPGQGTVITLIIPLDKHGNQRSPNGAGAA